MIIIVLRFLDILVDVIYYLYMHVNSESRSLPKNITIAKDKNVWRALFQADSIK